MNKMVEYQYRIQFHKDMQDIRTPSRTLNKARILGTVQPVIRGKTYHLFSELPLDELVPHLVVSGVSLTYLEGDWVRDDLPKIGQARE